MCVVSSSVPQGLPLPGEVERLQWISADDTLCQAWGKCELLPMSAMMLSASYMFLVEITKVWRWREPWELGKRRWVGTYVLIFSSVFPLLLCLSEASCVDLPSPTQNLKQLSLFNHLLQWHCLLKECSMCVELLKELFAPISYWVSLLLSAHPGTKQLLCSPTGHTSWQRAWLTIQAQCRNPHLLPTNGVKECNRLLLQSHLQQTWHLLGPWHVPFRSHWHWAKWLCSQQTMF